MPGLGGVLVQAVPPGYSDPHNWSAIIVPPAQGAGFGLGLQAWNVDVRQAGAAATALVSGTISLARIQLTGGPLTFSNVVVGIGTAGATLTAGQCFAGAYDDQGNQIGVSASQDVNWTSTGFKSMALTGAPFTGWWPFIYVALVSNGTTNPQFFRTTGQAVVANASAAGASMLFPSNGTSQTALPASFNYAVNSASGGTTIWAALA